MAAAIVDVSEARRETEMSGLEDLLAGSRVILGAVSHEIRNLAGAITVATRNLTRLAAKAAPDDVQALQSLAAGLERLAATQLRSVTPRQQARADLHRVLNEISIIAGPELESSGGNLEVDIEQPELWVRADHHAVLQVLLNLVNNAMREVQSAAAPRECRIAVARAEGRVLVRVSHSGDLVSDPNRLFTAFSEQARGTGLGLYVSRAIMRSYGGDLRYQPQAGRACFILELVSSALNSNPLFEVHHATGNPALPGG